MYDIIAILLNCKTNLDYNSTKHNIESIYIKHGLLSKEFGFKRESLLFWGEVEVCIK